MIKIINNFLKKIWLHLIVWSLFIVYEAVVIGLIFGVFGHPLTYLLHYILVIILFYATAEWLLPWCLRGRFKLIWAIPLGFSLIISGFILANYILDGWLVKQDFITHIEKIEFNREFVLRVLYRCIYILGFATAYYFSISYLKVSRNAVRIEKERLLDIIKNERIQAAVEAAENAFLRAQINPHFLFNTLSYIHHHVNRHSTEAADAIIQLSEIMRYALNVSHEEGFVRIGTEMDQVEKLLNLHQMRRPTMMHVHIDVDEQAKDVMFIPLVLLTLAENMIKYADFNLPDHPATLLVACDEKRLTIRSTNLINPNPMAESNGKGLQNILSRLQHSYIEKAAYQHHIRENTFEIEIYLDLS